MSFSPTRWLRKVGLSLPTPPKIWIRPAVVGPGEAAEVEMARRILKDHVKLGAGEPTDIFILSVGESPERRCTKIGGLPYMRRGQEWPRDSQGVPLNFLVQFDFSKSRDLVGQLPGDVLLVFGDLDGSRGFELFWEAEVPDSDLIGPNDLPTPPVTPEFWGTRWRTKNYPHFKASDDEILDQLKLPDGTEISSGWFALQLLGLQIGPHCGVLPGQDFLYLDEEVLCMATMVVPSVDAPYPFLNYEPSLDEDEQMDYSFLMRSIHDDDGFGLLYVIRNESGGFRCQLQNL